MRHLRTETRAAARPRRFTCEIGIFINGADTGTWVWPARAAANATAFGLRGLDEKGGWRTCRVTHDAAGARCTCPARTSCDHIRALRSCHLIP
jgi:hypothetical protein